MLHIQRYNSSIYFELLLRYLTTYYIKSNERNAYTRLWLDLKCPIIFLYTF